MGYFSASLVGQSRRPRENEGDCRGLVLAAEGLVLR